MRRRAARCARPRVRDGAQVPVSALFLPLLCTPTCARRHALSNELSYASIPPKTATLRAFKYFVACRACGAPGGLVAHGRHGMGATGGACPDKPPLASCHPRTATLRASAYFPTTSVSHVDGRGRVDPLSSRGVCVGSKGISHAPSCSTLRTRTAPASLVARRVPFARCETAHFDSGRGDVRSLFAPFTHTHVCATSRAIQRAIVRISPPTDGDATRV